MMANYGGILSRIETRSAELFLISGLLGTVYASFWLLVAIWGIDFPILRDVAFRLPGYVIGFIALVGLYPSLAERSPKLAATGTVFAGLGAAG
jgi:peptidoglycan/LPS O-acetylase OafA/YrhL